jgi:phage virion morphogenesis protein
VAGTAITITSNADQVANEIYAIAKRCSSAAPAMKIIGETVKDSVVQNFRSGGRPNGWAPLSPATLAKKKGGSILIGKGHAGGLMGSISYQAGDDHVIVGTNKVYAAIHQFGGMAGRGRKVKIPQREFLMVQDEDWNEIRGGLEDYIIMGV